MRGLSGMKAVSIPKGWRREALFGRLVTKGVCRYETLSSPETPIRDVFGMLRMLDLDEYLEMKSLEKADTHDH